ncbi:DUF5615 family PIN-like protein [Leptolyngbya cf. ectocarpi LEGE 11479]|uniref:DUF5615 family PIN-like protein n=1 Tax=Leptolyngbya cf. ectocarpi LEGE 11479 TaxID=1828722 RepID=A0A928ZYR2_LEPEC|nr:DUF5615 family PIN-like protein [Leptolyngbya ectocarpi]MBE9069886.1 DUF5615 family PIN-like protein [Leptolyngbya cf. ectocarpi LEGE 11479]
MVDLYSNENFPIDMVVLLRNLGYDVLTSYDAGQANQGIPDEDVLTYAIQNNRVVITLNRQDFINLHRSITSHNGIIICKDDRNYTSQIQALHTYLENQASLANRLIRVLKQNQPKSNQQIFTIREY